MICRIATRGSALALWQANHVASLFQTAGIATKLNVVKTTGDKVQDRFLHEIGGKGLFVRELEDAMLAGNADIAVHSLKDMPVRIPPAFKIAAILRRHAAHDSLIVRKKSALGAGLGSLDGTWITGAALASCGPMIIGTSSLRRAGCLAHYAPKVKTAPLRGNVDTRIRKLADGAFDGIILAGASLERIGHAIWDAVARSEFVIFPLDMQDFTPCAGQGALAIETLDTGDSAMTNHTLVHNVLRDIHCAETAFCVNVERFVLRGLGGDCTMPFGALCHFSDDGKGNRFVNMGAKIFDRAGNQAAANLKLEWHENLTPEACGTKLLNAIADDGAAAVLSALDLPVPESMRLH